MHPIWQSHGRTSLDYEPTKPQRRIVKLIGRRAFLIALIVLICAVAWRMVKQSQYLYWQHQCLTHQQAAQTVVYPTDAVTPHWPPGLFQILNRHAFAGEFPFLHERRSPNGTRRLVLVAFNWSFNQRFWSWSYKPASIQIGSALSDEISAEYELWPDVVTRMFAGQADAIDESHFTISTVTKSGEDLVFDGWLKNDGKVVIEPRRK